MVRAYQVHAWIENDFGFDMLSWSDNTKLCNITSESVKDVIR